MRELCIITGGSSGIGEALGRELASRGYPIGLIARREAKLRALHEELTAAGQKVAWVCADVTEARTLTEAVAKLEGELGPTGTLVANAGILLVSTSHRNKPERVLQQMRVNFDGVVHSIHAVLPGMLERQRGHLVAVSSVAGFRGIGNWAGYSAAKAAVTALMESYRIELTPEGIDCTTICPGFIESEMTAGSKQPMPFLKPAPQAAIAFADAIERRDSQYVYPWQMKGVFGVAKLLPNGVWDAIQRRGVKRYKPEE